MRSAIKGMLADMRGLFAMAALLCAAAIVLAAPCSALAVNEDDAASGARLTVYSTYGEEIIPGVNVDVYRVGEVGEGGTVVPEGAFAAYDVLWDVSSSSACQALANALEGYAMRDAVTPTYSAATDEQGAAAFPPDADQSLATGWYLVLAHIVSDDVAAYEIAPMLLAITADADDQAVVLKMSKLPVEEFVTLDVSKVWKGAGSDIPAKIEITLLRNGEVYQTVELGDGNGWHHAWKNLPAGYEWDVIEKVVPTGYKATVVKDGNFVTLINTREPGEEPPPPPHIPQTGGMWWPVLVLLVAGVALFALGVMRRSRG